MFLFDSKCTCLVMAQNLVGMIFHNVITVVYNFNSNVYVKIIGRTISIKFACAFNGSTIF